MSYPINYPTPQGANVQKFYADTDNNTVAYQSWIKPQGASFVWFTLIGGGSMGNSAISSGGGSGAVTNFMCPAFLIPDELQIQVGKGWIENFTGPVDTGVIYNNTYLLSAGSGGDSGGFSYRAGVAMSANYFTAMGFFQSIGGQTGSNGAGAVSASNTTFLSGGSSGSTNAVTANYGYSTAAQKNGIFAMSPIIVGSGGSYAGQGGIGCGGGDQKGLGGSGLVVIITW